MGCILLLSETVIDDSDVFNFKYTNTIFCQTLQVIQSGEGLVYITVVADTLALNFSQARDLSNGLGNKEIDRDLVSTELGSVWMNETVLIAVISRKILTSFANIVSIPWSSFSLIHSGMNTFLLRG